MHQLIVLGNGFDLECGLKSKFSDFFEERKKNLYPSAEDLGTKSWTTYIRESEEGLTAWDLVLCGDRDQNQDHNWYDIEDAIRQWVVRKPGGENEHCLAVKHYLSCLDAYINYINRLSQKSVIALDDERIGEILCGRWTEPHQNPDMSVTEYFDDAFIGYDQDSIERLSIQHLLLGELSRLENAFRLYLSNNLRNCRQKNDGNDYGSLAWELLKKLINDEGWSPTGRIEDDSGRKLFLDTSILDFNYTNPAEELASKMQVGTLVNIHGNLKDKNIIFGIDGKDNMTDPEVVPFTKTYRLLALNDPNRGKLVHTHADANGVTGLIKFYGHSLNPADYSYFQAIFDGVDLYQSHTRLVFYYKPWKKSDGTECTEVEAQQDMFDKVTRLMNTYGETMENEDHGQNLMHKLLLEGRLSIKLFKYANE